MAESDPSSVPGIKVGPAERGDRPVSARHAFPRFERLLIISGLLLAHFVTTRFGIWMLTPSMPVVSLWPAAGVLVGGLAILSPRERPTLIVGAFILSATATILNDKPFTEAVIFATAVAVEGLVFLGVYRFVEVPIGLPSPRQVGMLILVAALSSAVSGTVAVSGLVTTRGWAALEFQCWAPWFMAHLIGIIAVAPPLITATLAARYRIIDREAMLAIVTGAAVSAVVFLSPADRIPGQHIPVTLVFPFVFWCGARCSPLANAILACIISLIIMMSVRYGLGPFSTLAWPFARRIMTVQNFSLVISAGSLFLSILFSERRDRETQLARALDAQKALLHEVNHRVKNSLQLVTSILVIEAAQLKDAKSRAALKTVQSRIDIIATLHRRLYNNETHAIVDVGEAIEEVAKDVLRASGRKDVALLPTIQTGIMTDVAIATPICLAVAEIVTNAIKHAYPVGGGPIHLEVNETAGAVGLSVRDEGPGLPTAQAEPSSGKGMTIILDLFQQVNGEVDRDGESGGTAYSVRIPIQATDDRFIA